MSLSIQCVPSHMRRYYTTAKGFHTLRLLVGSALDLRMAADLDLSDPDYFLENATRRKLVFGTRDRKRLETMHPGALAFFSAPSLDPQQAKDVAAFIDTIPKLPICDEVFKKRLGELKEDLLYAYRHSMSVASFL